MRGLYFRDGEREVDVCASVHEHPDQLLIDVGNELERVAARFDRLPHGNARVRGAGYSYALPMRLVDHGILLFRRHGGRAIAHRRVVPDASRVQLDEVGSIPELHPHLLAPFPGRVDEMEITGPGNRAAYSFGRDPHARAGDESLVDGVAQVDIGGAAARQIARGRKAGQKVQPGID